MNNSREENQVSLLPAGYSGSRKTGMLGHRRLSRIGQMVPTVIQMTTSAHSFTQMELTPCST